MRKVVIEVDDDYKPHHSDEYVNQTALYCFLSYYGLINKYEQWFDTKWKTDIEPVTKSIGPIR